MMDIQQAYDLVYPFFGMKENQIIDHFGKLSRESIVAKFRDSDHNYVYIPGHRKDRALLVAHVDTVWHDNKKLEVGFNNQDGHALFYSATRLKGVDRDGDAFVNGLGIGADDRAGCAALWYLRNLGHSLLLTSGEEHGCLGSYNLMSSKKMAAEIQNHSFVMQFDRRGKEDLVFYHVGTEEFVKFMVKQTGYKVQGGSFTDICVLCERIPGVNVSIGYVHEHTSNEILSLRYWINTVEKANKLLSQSKLPSFNL